MPQTLSEHDADEVLSLSSSSSSSHTPRHTVSSASHAKASPSPFVPVLRLRTSTSQPATRPRHVRHDTMTTATTTTAATVVECGAAKAETDATLRDAVARALAFAAHTTDGNDDSNDDAIVYSDANENANDESEDEAMAHASTPPHDVHATTTAPPSAPPPLPARFFSLLPYTTPATTTVSPSLLLGTVYVELCEGCVVPLRLRRGDAAEVVARNFVAAHALDARCAFAPLCRFVRDFVASTTTMTTSSHRTASRHDAKTMCASTTTTRVPRATRAMPLRARAAAQARAAQRGDACAATSTTTTTTTPAATHARRAHSGGRVADGGAAQTAATTLTSEEREVRAHCSFAPTIDSVSARLTALRRRTAQQQQQRQHQQRQQRCLSACDRIDDDGAVCAPVDAAQTRTRTRLPFSGR